MTGALRLRLAYLLPSTLSDLLSFDWLVEAMRLVAVADVGESACFTVTGVIAASTAALYVSCLPDE